MRREKSVDEILVEVEAGDDKAPEKLYEILSYPVRVSGISGDPVRVPGYGGRFQTVDGDAVWAW